MSIDHQILCALKDLCAKWLGGLNVTVTNTEPLPVDMSAVVAALNNVSLALTQMPQLEGLHLTRWCETVGGMSVTTGFSSVIIPDESAPGVTQTIYFDAAQQPLPGGEVPNGAPCVVAGETHAIEGCMADGSPGVKFVTATGVVVGEVSHAALGFGECACDELVTMNCPSVGSPTSTLGPNTDQFGYSVFGTGTIAAGVKIEGWSAADHAAVLAALNAGQIVVVKTAAGTQVFGGPWGGNFSGDTTNGGTFAVTGVDHTVDVSGDPCGTFLGDILALAVDGDGNSDGTIDIYG